MKQKYILLSIGVILTSLALFLNLGTLALLADEPIRALVALEIELHGAALNPTNFGVTYLNKPPLYNWILIGFFKLFNSHSEFIIRLPSVLSLIGFAFTVFYFFKDQLGKGYAAIVGLALITGGHILFYSSMLGHIDLLYSWVVFVQFWVVFHYFKKEQWLALFAITYGLTVVGFLLKGLPSIVFQGGTLFAWFTVNRRLKQLFNWQHIVGALFFVFPVWLYLYLFSNNYSIVEFTLNLWEESSKRATVSKGIAHTIEHLFIFPLNTLIDILPWGLMVIFMFSKETMKRLWENQVFKFSVVTVGINIIVYWISPDTRSRYIFMLYPLILGCFLFGLKGAKKHQPKLLKGFWGVMSVVLVLVALGLLVLPHLDQITASYSQSVFYLLVCMLMVFVAYFINSKESLYKLIYLSFFLLTARILFNVVAIPERKITNVGYERDKLDAIAMAKITKGSPIVLYDNVIDHSMGYYLTLHNEGIIELKGRGNSFSLDDFYLVPEVLLKDSTKFVSYYCTTRRYKNTPFQLVKYKTELPKFPKATP